jgi:hypothetical protein
VLFIGTQFSNLYTAVDTIFKGQLSILLRLTEFVGDRKISELSNKVIAETSHALIRGAPEQQCSLGPPRIRGASAMHLA